jgi:hypothetical protein
VAAGDTEIELLLSKDGEETEGLCTVLSCAVESFYSISACTLRQHNAVGQRSITETPLRFIKFFEELNLIVASFDLRTLMMALLDAGMLRCGPLPRKTYVPLKKAAESVQRVRILTSQDKCPFGSQIRCPFSRDNRLSFQTTGTRK